MAWVPNDTGDVVLGVEGSSKMHGEVGVGVGVGDDVSGALDSEGGYNQVGSDCAVPVAAGCVADLTGPHGTQHGGQGVGVISVTDVRPASRHSNLNSKIDRGEIMLCYQHRSSSPEHGIEHHLSTSEYLLRELYPP